MMRWSLTNRSPTVDRMADNEFWQDVRRHVVRYGGAFTPEIIDRGVAQSFEFMRRLGLGEGGGEGVRG